MESGLKGTLRVCRGLVADVTGIGSRPSGIWPIRRYSPRRGDVTSSIFDRIRSR